MRFRAGARLDPRQVLDMRGTTGRGIFVNDLMRFNTGRSQIYQRHYPWDWHPEAANKMQALIGPPRAGYPPFPINVPGFPPRPSPQMVHQMIVEAARNYARERSRRQAVIAGRQFGGRPLRQPNHRGM